jgi:hypothetical protein
MAELPPEDSTTPLRVDVDGLSDFARQLRNTVESRLRPYVTEQVSAFRSGTEFGRQVESPNVSAARSHYTDCLAEMVDLLASVGTAGLVLAEAAELIARRYSEADGLAAASVESVGEALALANATTMGLPAVSQEPGSVTVNGVEAS